MTRGVRYMMACGHLTSDNLRESEVCVRCREKNRDEGRNPLIKEKAMGHHLTREGEFRSDKYPPCGSCHCFRPHAPIGYYVMKIADPNAWPALLKQAETTPEPELAEDLRQAVAKAMQEFGKPTSAAGK